MSRTAILSLLAALLPAAEPLPEDRGAAGLLQSFRKLQSTARVMHITAHPDDEDGGTITMLARGRGAHVTLAILNRGESGANLVSGDFFDRLGALRTAEILRAADFYGVKVRFTRFIDYGYSKNVAETFRQWDKDEVLGDLVRLIRMEQPHVLLSRWQGSPRDGHGNHEAAGVLAQLAFDAAGDASRFPEHIREGLRPWQPLKLYAGNRREGDDWTLRVDSGVRDPVLGRTYAQIAREGLRQQRSQGAGSAISRPGPSVSYYKLVASRTSGKDSDLLDGVPRATESMPELSRLVTAALKVYDPARPEACAPQLARALASLRRLGPPVSPLDIAIKEQQVRTAIGQALGVSLEALVEPKDAPTGPFAASRGWSTFRAATGGQTFTVSAALYGAQAESINLIAPAGWLIEAQGAGRFRVTVPASAQPTSAYWRRNSITETKYALDSTASFGLPQPPAPLIARATYRVEGVEVFVDQPVETSYMDRLGLQHRRTLVVAPAVSVSFDAEAGLLPAGKTTYAASAALVNHIDGPISGSLRLRLPAGWQSQPEELQFHFEREGEQSRARFAITPGGGAEGHYTLEAEAVAGGGLWKASFDEITQPGLETVILSRKATHQVRSVDAKIAPGLRTAYVAGTGDEVAAAIEQLGASVELLDTEALATGDLSRFDTILLGIRAYAARQDVKTYNTRLLDYVKSGGVLVVQYNTQEYDKNFGPYPYTMTARAEEVSEEDSPVEILAPDDPAFQWPNRITPRDFEGWVEQRGSKFWTTWDPAYKPLLATHDTGQPPQRGGWLAARHGQGLYVYCAYAWYRQRPQAVPGAARIFANLISLGSPENPWRKHPAPR